MVAGVLTNAYISLAYGALPALIVSEVDNSDTAVATSLNGMFRKVGGAAAAALVGALLTARIFGAQMTERRWGRLINMASIAGMVGEPNLAVYSASKGALIALTKALAIEWARYGVTVNALAPGYFRTDLNAQALDNPEVADRLLKKIPLRRAGEPAELAPLLVYLASEDSAFMTGSVLVIDGGQVAR